MARYIVSSGAPTPSGRRGSVTFEDMYPGLLATTQMAGGEGVTKAKGPAADLLDDFTPGSPDFFVRTRAGGIALLALVLAGMTYLDDRRRAA